jgi:hypothetical protein
MDKKLRKYFSVFSTRWRSQIGFLRVRRTLLCNSGTTIADDVVELTFGSIIGALYTPFWAAYGGTSL